MSNRFNIERAVKYADLLIGAVLVAGARAPILVRESMVQQMKPVFGHHRRRRRSRRVHRRRSTACHVPL